MQHAEVKGALEVALGGGGLGGLFLRRGQVGWQEAAGGQRRLLAESGFSATRPLAVIQPRALSVRRLIPYEVLATSQSIRSWSSQVVSQPGTRRLTISWTILTSVPVSWA